MSNILQTSGAYPTEPFAERARRAIADARLQGALSQAMDHFMHGRETAFAELDDAAALKRHGRAIREHTLAHLDDYLALLAQSVQRHGGHVHWARDATAANHIVVELARERGIHLAVKSKSMATEEIHLNHALTAAGIRPVETDLGEWIIQLAGETPSHIIGPALHKTKAEVIELFAKETGRPVPSDAPIPDLTRIAREELRQHFLAAGMGISGANFAVAETGTVVIVTNEGNGRFATGLPKIHVVVMGAEKVVPTWEDLMELLKLLTRSATGQRISSYVNCITGPRRLNEPDGPDEFHLIILDNGRSSILGQSRFREALYCIRCGACLSVCPVYRKIGGHAYGSVYPGPIGAVLTPLLQGLDQFPELPHASSLCGACKDACPLNIDLPGMLVELRCDAAEGNSGRPGRAPWVERALFRLYGWALQYPVLYRIGAKVGYWMQRPWIRNGRIPSVPIPPFSGWTAYRDFPQIAARPFHHRWTTDK